MKRNTPAATECHMGLVEALRRALQSSGLMFPTYRRSLWVHGETVLQFEAARQLLQRIRAERVHVRMVLTSGDTGTVAYLRKTFADEHVSAGPWNSSPIVQKFFRMLQVRNVLLLDGGRSFPSHAVAAALAARIPVSVVNVGHPAAMNPALLEAARQQPHLVGICVFDDVVAEQLHGCRVPKACVSVPGCLDLEPDRRLSWPRATAVRRRLSLSKEPVVVAALDVPHDEEFLVLDAFVQARQQVSDVKLLIAPRHSRQLPRLNRAIEARGLHRTDGGPSLRDGWDALVCGSPADIIPFLPAADVVMVGGTFGMSGGTGALIAAVISAGGRVVIGCHLTFSDLPWRFLENYPQITLAEPDQLAPSLARAMLAPAASEPFASVGDGATERTYAAISQFLPENPPLPVVAQDWRVPNLRDRAGASKTWQTLSKPLTNGRMDDWSALRLRLGRPRSILCLGNGPSSEDPELAEISHDCLMRVNWRWMERGFLCEPDLVFVGDPLTVTKIESAIFAFWNTALERGMLLRRLITRGPVPMDYFTMDRISPLVRDQAWPARPTNGALMVAAAAALAPERLIIAGIDLYLHPDGRYPGDLVGLNQYAQVHTRSTDLAIMRAALSEYRGELIVIGDQLQEGLDAPEEVLRAHV